MATRLPSLFPRNGSSCPWVSLVVAIAEPVSCHVGVDLRCAQTTVSEKLLDAANISAAIKQVRGEAVPQCVRAGAGVDTRLSKVFFQEPAHASTRQTGAIPV